MDISEQHDRKMETSQPANTADLDSRLASLTLTSSSDKNNSRLLSLPNEIHALVLSFLPWRSLLALRLTHSHFFTELLPTQTLPSHHTVRHAATRAAEIAQLHALGYSNRNWTGFTQGWGTTHLLSLNPTLPCYVCLRWLPAATNTTRLTLCAFTRAMATTRHDLAQSQSHRRVCIECGIRRGLYVRGNRVGHRPICYGCGALGIELAWMSFADTKTKQYVATRLSKGVELRLHYFCPGCVERDRDNGANVGEAGKVVPDTEWEFRHWRFWNKYEKGRAEGKRYRLENGRRLRAERGIVTSQDRDENVDSLLEPPHVCPLLKRKRWCQCWQGDDGPLGKHIGLWYFDEHGQSPPPHWIW